MNFFSPVFSKSSTSWHTINRDTQSRTLFKGLWFLANFFNGVWKRRKRRTFVLRRFRPGERILEFSPDGRSPSRYLCDLFWKSLAWDQLLRFLGEIRILDVGCGAGQYAEMLNGYSEKKISSYLGIDIRKNLNWEKVKSSFVRFQEASYLNIADLIVQEKMNVIISQSAIEHFEEDLRFFCEIAASIERMGKPMFQVHLFPSFPCISLYKGHGVRQYNLRTVEKIVACFSENATKSILFGLGGDHCNFLHREFISDPLRKEGCDWRKLRPEDYSQNLKVAIKEDSESSSRNFSFLGLCIMSHFQMDPLQL